MSVFNRRETVLPDEPLKTAAPMFEIVPMYGYQAGPLRTEGLFYLKDPDAVANKLYPEVTAGPPADGELTPEPTTQPPIAETKIFEEKTNSAAQEVAEQPEVDILFEARDKVERKTSFDLGRLAISGIYRASQIIRSANRWAAMPINTLDNASRYISVRALTNLPSFEKKPTVLPGEKVSETQLEIKKSRKKTAYKSLGGLAITGVAAVGIYYLTTRGIAHNPSVSHLHEAMPAAPARPAAVQEALPATPFHVKAAEKFANHAPRVSESVTSIKANLGDGYTQLLAKVFPNHSAATYLNGYKEAIQKLGPNFIKGIPHYRMPDGGWGLRGTGRAELTQKSMHLLTHYFNSHQ